MNSDSRILYLEDDLALARITQRGLEKRGYAVSHYDNIDSLREALNGDGIDYEYALLDLKIGNDTSLQFITDITRKGRVPVVVLTGYGTVRTAVKAMQLGAINVLTKPASIDDIINALLGHDTEQDNIEVEKPSLKAQEWEAIQKALDEHQGNVTAAARQLKMHRRTLQRKLKKRHID